MKKFNTVISSRINRSFVLAEIHRNPMISRVQLAAITGLDRSAITQILNFLLGEGLVKEVEFGAPGKRGGRRPIHLRVQYDARCMVLVEVGSGSITGSVSNLGGEEFCRHSEKVERGAAIIEAIAAVIAVLQIQAPDQFNKTVLINISCPGVIDRDHGKILVNTFQEWRNIPLAEEITNRFGKPCFVENDANAAAVGELYRLGPTERPRSLVYLFIRDSLGRPPLGVGGAIILNGRLWAGAHSFAGESSQTINEYFHQVVAEYDKTIDQTPDAGTRRSLASLIERSEQGEEPAKRALQQIADRLGSLLGEYALFLDPDAVMVSLHPFGNYDPFLDILRASYESHLDFLDERSVPFLHSSARQRATLEGLIALGQERVFIVDSSRASLLFAQELV